MAFRRITSARDDEWYEAIEDLILSTFHAAVTQGQANSKPARKLTYISNLHQQPVAVAHTEAGTQKLIQLLRNTYEYRVETGTAAHSDKSRAPGRYESAVISGFWHDMHFWIRFETFEEYFSVTTKLCLDSDASTSDATDEWRRVAHMALNPTIKIINDRYKLISTDPTAVPPKLLTDAERNRVDYLFNGLWNDFRAKLFDAAFSRTKPFISSNRTRSPRDALGLAESAFADFRSLYLGLDFSAGIPCEEFIKLGIREARTEDQISRPLPFRSRIVGSSQLAERKEYYSNAWVEALLPILMAQDGYHSNTAWHPPIEPIEYTFSQFGNAECIYGSGFGAQFQPEDPGATSSNSPLVYVVLALHDEWRQLGRTAQRLHTLGTLRLAALFELRKLMVRDRILLALEEELGQFDTVRTPEKLRNRLKEALETFSVVSRTKAVEAHVGQEYARRLTQISEALETYTTATRTWIDLLQYRRHRKQLIELLRPMVDELEAAKEKLKMEELPSRETTSDLDALRNVIRSANLFIESDDLTTFRAAVLDQVRKALSGMNEGVREGITYRAARSRYSTELFASLCDAMRIREIAGYQPYDLFVKHRLERAFRLVQAIDARFRQVSSKEEQLRSRLTAAKSVRHQGVLSRLQSAAEHAFWFVLAPYYSGSLAKLLVEGSGKALGIDLTGFASAASVLVGATVLSVAVVRWSRERVERLEVPRTDVPKDG